MELGARIYFFFSCVTPFVLAFSWRNCGSTMDPIQFSYLDVFSDQTQNLYITGKGQLGTNITSPVGGTIDLKKKFFWGWLHIPCVNQLGSCSYEDLCQLNPYANLPCPQEFVKNNVPCRCPFQQGMYSLDKYPLGVNTFPLSVDKGKYRIKLRLHQNNRQLTCLLMNIQF